MKKTCIQFHASVAELTEFANMIKNEFGLVTIITKTRPLHLAQVEKYICETNLTVEANRGVRIIFSYEEFDLNESTLDGLYDQDPGLIALQVGQIVKNSLEESCLSFMSDDVKKIELAKKVAAKLKKITKAGPIALNDLDDEETKARNHRYSAGAKKMYEEGIRLQAISPCFHYKIA